MSALRARVTAIADQGHRDAVDAVCRLIDAVIPVGTGPGHAGAGGQHLIDSRVVESTGPRSTRIRYDGLIANYLDSGTGPHVIYPTSGRALAFVWPTGPPALAANPASRLFVLDHVNHPGSHRHDGWWSRNVNAEVWQRVCEVYVAEAAARL